MGREGTRLWQEPSLQGVGEDRFLADVFALLPGGDDVLVGPGDDAAVLAPGGRLVVTTDTMVLGRDWLDDHSSAADVGGKCVVANLSDVEAMGARPTGLVVTLVADPRLSHAWALELLAAIGDSCRQWDVAVLGGDLSSAPDGVVAVSITALGELAAGVDPVLRSGARAGDVVAVCGRLGYAAAGLRLVLDPQALPGAAPPGSRSAAAGSSALLAAECLGVQRRPDYQRGQGEAAARAGATAMLDLSDGLARDAGRIARASGADLDLESAALAGDVDRLAPLLGPDAARACVVGGGEEHSLLATFPAEADLPHGWRRIGTVRVAAGAPGVRIDGIPARADGWDHFGG